MLRFAHFMAKRGINATALTELGCFSPCGGQEGGCSYWQHMRSLPATKAVLLEYFRTSLDLYACVRVLCTATHCVQLAVHPRMARQHLWLQDLEARGARVLTLRFEDLKDGGFDRTVAALLDFMALQLHWNVRRQVMGLVKQRCDVASMSRRKVVANNHITSGKVDRHTRQQLRSALLEVPEVLQQVCEVAAVLAYSIDECNSLYT